jgi:Cft2 family RNA processing exonuclease
MDIYCAGGSGEQGRTAYLISEDGFSVLLDYGVQRVFTNKYAGKYPFITPDMLGKVQAVVLSHAHEDHAASLPLLVKQNKNIPIYCHAVTANLVPDYCRAWSRAVQMSGFSLPYKNEDIASLNFVPKQFGEKFHIGPFMIEIGPSGHMPGSVWVAIQGTHQSLLYTGDCCWENRLLCPPQLPTEFTVTIANSAYGNKLICQAEQEKLMITKVTECIQKGGSVLLPVPRIGRGQELIVFLSNLFGRDIPVMVEEGLVVGLQYYNNYSEGLSKRGRNELENFDMSKLHLISHNMDLEMNKKSIIIAPDGMLSTGASLKFFWQLAKNEKNFIILTGHQAEGTLGAKLLEGQRCIMSKEVQHPVTVKAQVVKTVWKAHPDFNDLYRWLERCPKEMKLYLGHCDLKTGNQLIYSLAERGIAGEIIPVGSTISF